MSNFYLIAHRGNINGRKIEEENKPEYIDLAISEGYDVEIDVWFQNGEWYLGHDKPETEIDVRWLLDREEKLWIHCKNMGALMEVKKYCLHYFWHENDEFTLTSKNYVWAFPTSINKQGTISVLPEIHSQKVDGCKGVCSDFVQNYKK